MEPETVINTQNIPQAAVDQAQNTSVPESENEINWKKFREQREKDRQELISAEKKRQEKEAEAAALKAALDSLLTNQKQQLSSHESYEDDEISDAKRIQLEVERVIEAREKENEKKRQIKEQQEFPDRLRSVYKDFDQACTTENLDYLEYHYPEIATGFKKIPDSFDKWAAIYQTVKKLIPNTDSKKDQAKALRNLNKPQAISVPGVTQTGDNAPQILDDAKKAANYARMQRVMKGG